MDKINVYILQLWHNAPYMLDKSHIIANDFTPVIFNNGQGEFHTAGYIAEIVPDKLSVSVIFDHSFNITDGRPPAPEDYILCDKIKESITGVISKTISTLQIELKSGKVDNELEYLIEKMDEDPEMPTQLTDILRWEVKKLMTDYKAEYNPNPYDPSFYFSKSPDISIISDVVSTWDMFFNLSQPVIDKIIEGIATIPFDADNMAILKDLDNGIIEHMDNVKRIRDTIARCQEASAAVEEE